MSRELTTRLRLDAEPEFSRDWQRQRKAAADILHRLKGQEGVILADQVGMGKTYVALAVAVSQILATDEHGQVLVLAPPAVASKWVAEWRKFSDSLLKPGAEIRCVDSPLRSGETLLAALDDPPETRCHLIVATHTALTSTLKDAFIQLALLHFATRRRPNRVDERRTIARWSDGRSGLLRDPRFTAERVVRLLETPPSSWRTEWHTLTDEWLHDDPVPAAVVDALGGLDLARVRACIVSLPKKSSAGIERRLRAARAELTEATQDTWKSVLSSTDISLPLLIVDEAHRLKNDDTKISQLFAARRPGHESGALTGIFDRMLLLTATPFELGHSELVRVLSRLNAVRERPSGIKSPLDERLDQLGEKLKQAQGAAITLDEAWSRLAVEDLAWFEQWAPASPPPEASGAAVASAWRAAHYAVNSRRDMHAALQPWVIRHQREHRRTYRPGDSISVSGEHDGASGLAINDDVALPFLLAARAQAEASEQTHGAARPHFAYGIASSFEAFRRLGSSDVVLDSDSDDASSAGDQGGHEMAPGAAGWYRQEIDSLLLDGGLDRSHHPKVKATVDRAADLWLRGHKCLVFCWFIKTGEAIENAIQNRVDSLISERAGQALGIPGGPEVTEALGRISDRLLRRGSPSYDATRSSLEDFFASCVELKGDTRTTLVEALVDIAVRHLRTPSYLVRYCNLSPAMTADDLWDGVEGKNPSGVRLLDRWQRFAIRVSSTGEDERDRILEAVLGEQVTSSDHESAGAEGLSRGASLRSVRRAHGGTNRDTRERLTALFNTPFAPDILVASSVMGEGIDLHIECRHVIHHDLDWNPSVLEQRTGRLDRIGALAERDGCNIEIYEPYLAGTHDEKMYRVVKDRAGWFDIVMGRATATDEGGTDAEEKRGALAPSIAEALKMDLRSR